MLIEINWGNFRAKFNGREQRVFEWLCSLLFYKEHDRPTGELRYFNQPGIEAEPVTVGEEVIGWQAKFIDTDLAKYKNKLIEAIDTAKAQHEALTQIYFYVNLDFGRSRKADSKDPRYKTEIEEYAKTKGVLVTWRTASFFESPFVCEINANISKHFFTLDVSIIDFVQSIAHHSNAILEPIRSEIILQNRVLKIDRESEAQRIKDALLTSSIVVISGDGGVGKTAVIKDFYNSVKGNIPFFVFKASEFNVSHINQLFKEYDNFTFLDFVSEHDEFKEKYIVIDSAEKLADIERVEVFQEFLSTLRTAKWKILFTTRQSYLDDLKYTLIEFYNTPFEPINISGLSHFELAKVSQEYNFILPHNERLLNVLENPFYLNEFLRIYPEGNGTTSYTAFRNAIWNRQVARSTYRKDNIHRMREECFIELAYRRAASGGFFINLDGFDVALQQLESDEIIKFDPKTRGYFITHDIYEEWALERKLEQTFHTRTTDIQFYEQIGDALAVRRAFRCWLSNKLEENDSNISRFIEATVSDEAIAQHWKDEAIVAALLSNYSSNFVQYFEGKLLDNTLQRETLNLLSKPNTKLSERGIFAKSLLYRIIFLLRVACKEVDQNFIRLLRVAHKAPLSLNVVITQPKGSGWNSVIAFLARHKEKIGLQPIHIILPLLDEWVRYHKQGETTKAAGQIALYYFLEQTKDGRFPYSAKSEAGGRLIRIILDSSGEIKDDLAVLFQGVIERKDVLHDSCYYELATTALSSIHKSALVAQNLPKEVIGLANIFWPYTPPKRSHWGEDHRNDIEQYFDLAPDDHEYYPSSALQTPLSQLLLVVPLDTVNFILLFINRSINFFAKTNRGKHEVDEVNVYLSDSEPPIKQYISHRLWMMYRGTQSGPTLLESIHMALEQWLLSVVKKESAEVAENWCLYLMKNSCSSSITAVVVSAVLAEPLKLFNVAQRLFRTKSFFMFDNARRQLDMKAKSHYAMSYDPIGLFKHERLSTCDDKHRSWSLENMALNYQLIRYEPEDEEQVIRRQEIIWAILDQYYARLPAEAEENDRDKIWRLCLARMDLRRMTISAEDKNDKVLLRFIPEIAPELKAYSDSTLEETANTTRYLSLSVWAQSRWEMNSNEYLKYAQYDSDPMYALAETRSVCDILRTIESENDSFYLSYRAVPSFVCSVLIRDFANTLGPQDIEFCRNTLIECASLPLRDNYNYQVGDGLNASIETLPLLLKYCPESHLKVKSILLFTLLDQHSAGMGNRISDHAVQAITGSLWKLHSEDANSLFLGYLHLKSKFDNLCKLLLEEKQAAGDYHFTHFEAVQRFISGYQSEIDKVLRNDISDDQGIQHDPLNIDSLVTAFKLLPLGTENQYHKVFAVEVATAIAIKSRHRSIHDDDRVECVDFSIRHRFLPKFAQFVLCANRSEIPAYIQPFVDNLLDIEGAKEIFQEFLSQQDRLNRYDAFWLVWEQFYPSIVAFCNGNGYPSTMIYYYLLATPHWREGAKEWHSLKEREKIFFMRVVRDIGSHPAVLYSLAKVLNDVGSGFVADGILWISSMLEAHANLADAKLETNTEYYLEKLIRGYVFHNRETVRMTSQIKKAVLTILNFLLEKGSVTAYLTREHIL